MHWLGRVLIRGSEQEKTGKRVKRTFLFKKNSFSTYLSKCIDNFILTLGFGCVRSFTRIQWRTKEWAQYDNKLLFTR